MVAQTPFLGLRLVGLKTPEALVQKNRGPEERGPRYLAVGAACGGWQQAGSNTAGEARTQNGKRPVDGSADPVFGSAACRFENAGSSRSEEPRT